MKKLFFLSALFTLVALCYPSSPLFAQSRRTKLSATCGSCGRAVAASSRVGQRCPHCGVIWGRENTTTTTGPSYSIPKYSTNNFADVPNYNSGSLGGYDSSFGLDNESNTIRTCNLRAAPSAKAVVLGSIPRNSSVTILKRSGGWVKVSYMGSLGGDYNIGMYRGWLQRSNLVY